MKKSEKKYSEESIVAVLIMFFIFLLIYLILKLGIISYIGYKMDCFPEQIEQILKENDLKIAGQYNPSDNKIYIYVNDSTFNRVVKHERVHYFQHLRDYEISCEYPLIIYFSEFEASLAEYLPNPIYKIFY